MKLFYALIYTTAKLLAKVIYRHHVYGLEHVPNGPAILAGNHVSFLDPPLIGISCSEEVNFLARSSLFDHRLFGLAIRNLNAYPVSGDLQNLNTFKTIARLLHEQKKVVIFPEGNRTPDGKLGKIKPGVAMVALRSNAPVVPVYVHGTYEAWPSQKRFPSLSGKTTCVFGTPLYPDTYRAMEKKAAYLQLSLDLEKSLHALEEWYRKGAVGSPP